MSQASNVSNVSEMSIALGAAARKLRLSHARLVFAESPPERRFCKGEDLSAEINQEVEWRSWVAEEFLDGPSAVSAP